MKPPERASALVLRWARIYTRRLPSETAQARYDELACDLWEQRSDSSQEGAASSATALAIVRRMLAGIPADLAWRHDRIAAARHGHVQRIDGRIVMTAPSPLARTQRRITTRRCKACGERYRRTLPYCPVCKARPGDDGVPHSGDWSRGIGLGSGSM